MKKIYALFIMSLFFVVIMSGCGGNKAVEIKGLTTYTDGAMGFVIKSPSNWLSQNREGERFISFTSAEGLKRFHNYDVDGETAAKIEVNIVQLSENQTIDSVMFRKIFQKEIYSKPENITIDGIKAFKQTYTFDLNDGQFQGEIYYAQKDPKIVTVISFEAFGGTFDKYKEKFAEIIKDAKLAYIPEKKADTVKVIKEADPPSAKLTNYTGEGFTIMLPDNFSVKTPKTNSLKYYRLEGDRRGDCNITIDIIDASKQNKIDKIAQDNKAKFGNSEPKATNISGQKAYVFELSASAEIQRRAYFVVNGNKLYRIIMDWNKVKDTDMYKPIFEKCIASFKFQ